MQHEIIIRQASKSDIAHIMSLVQELAEYERALHEVNTSYEDYASAMDDGRIETILAVQDEKIIGMALYYTMFSTWKGKALYLEDLIVRQAYRKQGVGTVLMDAFLWRAKEVGAKMVKWQVLDWNQTAMNFYSKYSVLYEKEWLNVKKQL